MRMARPFDSRIAAVARQFEDFKNAEKQGAVLAGESIAELAKAADLPADALANTLGDIPNEGTDAFGRLWSGQTPPLRPTYHAVKVTGALFHTQGGLEVDPATTRVRRAAGGSFDNLHAVGGAACGVSGTGDSGYLSGNGLLAAVTLGYLAGRA